MAILFIIIVCYLSLWFVPFKEKPKRRNVNESKKMLRKPGEFPRSTDHAIEAWEVSEPAM